MATITAVLDGWKSDDLDRRAAAELAEDLIGLRRLVDLLELESARRLSAFTSVNGHQVSGHSSPTSFLVDTCRMAGARAHRSVALANKLPKVPFVKRRSKAATSLWIRPGSSPRCRTISPRTWPGMR